MLKHLAVPCSGILSLFVLVDAKNLSIILANNQYRGTTNEFA